MTIKAYVEAHRMLAISTAVAVVAMGAGIGIGVAIAPGQPTNQLAAQSAAVAPTSTTTTSTTTTTMATTTTVPPTTTTTVAQTTTTRRTMPPTTISPLAALQEWHSNVDGPGLNAISSDYQSVSDGANYQITSGDATEVESAGRTLETEITHLRPEPQAPNASVQAAWTAVLNVYFQIGQAAAAGDGQGAMLNYNPSSELSNLQKAEEAAGLNV